MLTKLEFSRDADALFAHVEACWRDACGGRHMPTRQSISPSKLGRALPYVSLLDVLPGDPIDFQYRLIGQHLIVNLGQNLTGKRCLELPQGTPAGRPIYAAYVKCLETREIQRVDIEIYNLNGTKRRVRAIVLPLGNSGEAPNALLGAGFFYD